MSALLEQARRNRVLFDRPLVMKRVPHGPPTTPPGTTLFTDDSSTPLGTLGGKPLRQAFDHAHAAKIFKDKTGTVIKSDIPPGPYKNCVFCQGILGKTLVPFDESKPGRPPMGHAYEHNPFRCPAANLAADQFCAKYGVSKEDFLKPLDSISAPICEALVAAAQ